MPLRKELTNIKGKCEIFNLKVHQFKHGTKCILDQTLKHRGHKKPNL